MERNVFLHFGDLGDIISSLPTVKALGGGDYKISWKPEGQRECMRGARYEAIKPLLEAQPYVFNVSWTETPLGATHDFSAFRHQYRVHDNLALQHARHCGVKISLAPWLRVNKPIAHEVTVIARSSRYHNPLFPWRKVLSTYPERIFVGLPTEHKAFEESYGQIPYYPTNDLLELASVIAGAKLLISNQTCAWWIGAGLGIPVLQETWVLDQNSVIQRPSLSYSRTVEEVNALLSELVSVPPSVPGLLPLHPSADRR